jgi:hypothetical protein
MCSVVKPIEMKNSTCLTRASFTCLNFICRCALLQTAFCSWRHFSIYAFPGDIILDSEELTSKDRLSKY